MVKIKHCFQQIVFFALLISFTATNYSAEKEKLQLLWGVSFDEANYQHVVEKLDENKEVIVLLKGGHPENPNHNARYASNYAKEHFFKNYQEAKVKEEQEKLTKTYRKINDSFLGEAQEYYCHGASIAPIILDSQEKKIYFEKMFYSNVMLIRDGEIILEIKDNLGKGVSFGNKLTHQNSENLLTKIQN